jgi:hypothetical protein
MNKYVLSIVTCTKCFMLGIDTIESSLFVNLLVGFEVLIYVLILVKYRLTSHHSF